MKLKAAFAMSLFTLFMSSQANAFTVGVAMPTQDEGRWYNEGFGVEHMLQQSGFNVELFFVEI